MSRVAYILTTCHDLESNKIERYPSYTSVTLSCTGRRPQTLRDSATPCQKTTTLSFRNSRVGAPQSRRQYWRTRSRQAAAPCQKGSESYCKNNSFSNRVSQSRSPATPVKMRVKIQAHRQPGRNGGSEKESAAFSCKRKKSPRTQTPVKTRLKIRVHDTLSELGPLKF